MTHPFAAASKASHSRRLKTIAGKSTSGSSGHEGTHMAGVKSVVHRMADEELPVNGGKPKTRADRFARGGAVKGKKHGTHVNIVIAGKPGGDATPAAVPVPVPVGGPPAMPPRPPMMAGPPPGGPPGGLPMPPPGMMRKRGGAVMEGKDDAAEDRKRVSGAVHKHEKPMHKGEKETKLASGGVVKADKTLGMTAGAESGEGRLEKTRMAARK